jgi:hypothetical protein
VDVTEFQTTEAYSNLDLSIIKYGTYKNSREDIVWVIERIKPKIFIISENKQSTCLCKYNFESKETSRSLTLLVRVMAA